MSAAPGTSRSELAGTALYVVRRLGQGVLVLCGAILISFVIVHLTGNPAVILYGGTKTPAEIARLSQQLGYDRPLPVQFLAYVTGLLHGNLGTSFRGNVPAADLVMAALPRTLVLVIGASAFACLLAFPISVFSVLHHDEAADRWMRRALLVIQGLPDYWLALMLVLLFAVTLQWLPSVGLTQPASVILPVVALGLPISSVFVRIIRAALFDVMSSDLALALRGKGLTDLQIVLRHGLRNALAPFVTYLGLQLGWLVGGTVLVEAVFAWPGMGSLLVNAVKVRDLVVVQAVVVVISATFVVLNLAVDVVLLAIDPRIRRGRL